MKNEIDQSLYKYKHANDIHVPTENNKTIEPHKFVLCLPQILVKKLRQICSSSKLVYLLHVEKYQTTV